MTIDAEVKAYVDAAVQELGRKTTNRELYAKHAQQHRLGGFDSIIDLGGLAGGGAPANAQYLVLALNGALSVERVLTPGSGLGGADGGANAAYTLKLGPLTEDWSQTGVFNISHAGHLILINQKEARFVELTANGSNYVGLKAAAALAASLTYTLPSADGAAGTLLMTSGAAVMSWRARSTTAELAPVAATEGAGTDTTIPNGDHAHALGIGTARGDILAWDSTPKAARLAIGAAETVLSSDGTDATWRAHFHTQIIVFAAPAEDLASGVLMPIPGVCVGEAGEHGTLSLIRAKAFCGTVGVGTNTIVIEADDSPAFATPTTIYTLALDASQEVDDTTQDNTWVTTDNFIRARCTAVGATAPKNVVVQVFMKQQAEAF